MNALLPIVGYPGGKRRLLSQIRPCISPCIASYAEPFAGMGAVYLDLVARGFAGEVVLGESIPELRVVWELLHSDSGELLVQAQALPVTPTIDDYRRMIDESVSDTVERAARFLWITNYAFGNQPPIYNGNRWNASGTKLISAARWGKTFPWADCVERLAKVRAALRGRRVKVVADGREVLNAAVFTYADPPYLDTREYSCRWDLCTNDLAMVVLREARGPTLLSEKRDLRSVLPAGWSAVEHSVVQRTSHGEGAKGKRAEWLYFRHR